MREFPAEDKPEEEGDKEAVQRIHLGDDGLRPPDGRESEDHRTANGGQPLSAEVLSRPVDEGHGQRGADSREQVHAEGRIAQRQQPGEEPAQERVQRVTGLVGDPQRRPDELKLQRIAEDVCDGRSQRAHVEAQAEQEHQRREKAIPMRIADCRLQIASCLLPLASCLLPPASCFLLPDSCFLPLASCILHLASYPSPLSLFITGCMRAQWPPGQ